MDQSPQIAIGQVLREAFVESQVRNPAYSLRSFARRLAISPSALSEILNGKRRISRKLAERLADKLCLEPKQRHELLSRFRPAGATSKDVPFPPLAYQELDADQFATMAEWYHFGILSLMETAGFVSDPAWISERLAIKLPEATAAIERLLRLGLVARGDDGALKLTKGRLTTSDGVRSISLRRAHATNLALAQKSLEEDDVDVRDFSAMTLAIDAALLPEAKKIIREFQDRLADRLEVPGKQTEVYKLCVQLFPLSHPTGAKS